MFVYLTFKRRVRAYNIMNLCVTMKSERIQTGVRNIFMNLKCGRITETFWSRMLFNVAETTNLIFFLICRCTIMWNEGIEDNFKCCVWNTRRKKKREHAAAQKKVKLFENLVRFGISCIGCFFQKGLK